MKNSELKEFIYDIIEREYPLESFNTKEEYISIIDELNDIKNEINDSLLYRVKEELAEEEPTFLEELDLEKLSFSDKEASDYKKNISEILIYIKQNSSNEEKQESVLEFVEDNKNYKYTVSINYDNNGLARIIRAKIQED